MKIKITSTPEGGSKIWMNDEEITSKVRNIGVTVETGELSSMTIEFTPSVVAVTHDDEVLLDDAPAPEAPTNGSESHDEHESGEGGDPDSSPAPPSDSSGPPENPPG